MKNTSYECWKALYLKAYPDATDVKHTSFDIIIELIKALDETVNTQIISSEYSALHELCYLLSGDATIRSSRYDYLLNLLKYYDADAKASTEYDCLVKLVDYIEFTVTSGLAITNIASNARTLYLQSAPTVGNISYSTDKCKTWTSIASGESVSLRVESGDTVYAKNYYSGDIDSISSSSQVSNYQIHASGSNASFEVKGDLSEWIYTDSNFDSKQVVKHAFSLLVGGPIVWEIKQWARPTSNYEYEYFYYPTTAEETKHTITLDNSFDGCFSDNQHFRHMFARCSNCHIDLSKVDMSGWNPTLSTFGWMHVGGETTVYLSQSQYDEFTANIVLGTTSTFTTDTVMYVNAVKKFDVLQNTAINFDNADKLTEFSASDNFLTYWSLQVTNDFGSTWRDVETETSQNMLDYVHSADVVYMRGFLKKAVSSSSTITSGMNIQYTEGTTATVGGYLTSLMYNADFNDWRDRWADAQDNVTNYMFSRIFRGCGFTVADCFHGIELSKSVNGLLQYAFENCTNLTTIIGKCIRINDSIPASMYLYTFNGCSSLVSIPNDFFEGITTVGTNGCSYMFQNCSSLVSAPNLPATTLGTYAYRNLFYGCSSLVNVQEELPSLSVPSNAYNAMYQDCTSLVRAPQLLATEVASNGCANMFRGCSSLVVPPVIHATKLAGSCFQSMMQNCTSLVESPQLPATELASNCYNSLFSGCSNLEKAPVLLATELASNCYTNLFRGCVKLTKVVTYQIETPSTTYNNTWLYSIRTEGTIYAPNGADWSEITSTSIKPATWNVVVGTGE